MNRRPEISNQDLKDLHHRLDGDLKWDPLHRAIYATDASVYRRLPAAVAMPANENDLRRIVDFANEKDCGITPRTAGTSLAGQCVTDGIVLDMSKHFGNVRHIDVQAKTATVQPGVVRDDLNRDLRCHGLFFSPNTSTSNRCMIGGMVGNNSSGTTSIRYGCTRDKIHSLQTILSDGSEATFSGLSAEAFEEKTKLKSLEGDIYRALKRDLSPADVRHRIAAEFPDPVVTRRNTGYAIDELIKSAAISGQGQRPFRISDLLTGSEGTLAITTSITLSLDDLPPPSNRVVIAHFDTIEACLQAVPIAMEHHLFACEMLDRTILNLATANRQQSQNRRLIDGDPAGILMLQLRGPSDTEVDDAADKLRADLRQHTASYSNLVLVDSNIRRINELRKSGLGILGNMVGDAKAVACVEDTAVPLEKLADYIAEFTAMMRHANQQPVYYAHAGAGEIHLRPILNLKRRQDVRQFAQITASVAALVKKYRGSMSGEHGDGIVRSGHIETIIGKENYELIGRIKSTFDPNGIFNPGKIVSPFPIDQSLRYQAGRDEPEIKTLLNFQPDGGILRHAEKCNGSGDCLKSLQSGGVMCPSYRVTNRESDSTRGRANALREILTHGVTPNRFDSEALRTAFDLCISCKACKRECPSSVDMAALKAEFEYQYQSKHGTNLRTKLFAHNDSLNRWCRLAPRLSNAIVRLVFRSQTVRRGIGLAADRTLPALSDQSLRHWCRKHLRHHQPKRPHKTVFLFVDEFTNQLDSHIGQDAIKLLTALGYRVEITKHPQSGRAYFSKGFLPHAKRLANRNLAIFDALIDDQTPLIGIEPSAIFMFRDEYQRLADDPQQAQRVSRRTFLIDEFLANEFRSGAIESSSFDRSPATLLFHGHCHQKSLSEISQTRTILEIPDQYQAELIAAGCCGMAGAFGYEAEHFEQSMAMARQGLLPRIGKANPQDILVANGTSCRQQIHDATGRTAVHPVTVLRKALRR